jgi:hypothetical protein
MKKYLPALSLFLLVFCFSCEEDVDLTAPYKDITVVYGLLDHHDSVHYIRIQKAFLGDGNALVYSTIPDSLYYPAGLNAYILGYDASGVKVDADSFHLERVVNEVVKDSGLFATYNHVLYKGVQQLNPSHTYRLIIIKPNGDTTWAETAMAGNISLEPQPNWLDWEPENIMVTEKFEQVTWAKNPHAVVYAVSLYFNYQEWIYGNPSAAENKQVHYHFAMFKPTFEYECNTNHICFPISKTQFYSMLKNQIEADPENTLPNNLRIRKFTGIDIKVTEAQEALYLYIKINATSLSLVQKANTYTNIHGGLGVFSARSSSGYTGIALNPQTMDSLRWGQYTHQLNFQP